MGSGRNLASQTLNPMPMSSGEFAKLSDYDTLKEVVKIPGARLD